jgi:hypothetical protein
MSFDSFKAPARNSDTQLAGERGIAGKSEMGEYAIALKTRDIGHLVRI